MAFLSCWQFTMICLLDGCWHRLWSSCAFILSYISFFLSWSMVDLQRCVSFRYVAAAAKSLQSCPTLCDPIDGSPPGSTIPGILQARTLEWVAISFSNAWKRKVKVKSLSVSDSSRPHGLQPTRLLCPWDFPGKSTGVGCQCLLLCNIQVLLLLIFISLTVSTPKVWG